LTQNARRNSISSNVGPETRHRMAATSARGSCIAIAGVLGLLGGEASALAETADKVEREARLAEDQQGSLAGRRMAQNVSGGFSVGKIAGPANSPIPISVRAPDINDGVYNFLVFQNLPSDFDMSAGFPVEDRWVVPLDEVSELTVTAPEGYSGRFDLQVKLRIGGTEKSETRSVAVEIFEPGRAPQTAQATTGAGGGSGSLAPETEAAMIERAQAMLETRDVTGARNIYQFLVRKGSGKAAFGLARTYDPAYVDEIGVAGMDAANLEQAKKWYERAALLGHEEAQERLKVLAAGG